MSTFVSVGNGTQHFTRLLEGVAAIASQLPQPVFVQHGNTPFESTQCEAVAFLEMSEFEKRVAAADLLILQAGAGSVLHAVRAGKVPVVMPRQRQYGELVDDHQLSFARELARAGRVVVAEEPADLMAAITRALGMQRGETQAGRESLMLKLVGETLAGYTERSR